MAAANVIQITATNFDSQVLNSAQPVLVDFWAQWCQPCRMLGPTIDALATEYAGRASVVKVNVDEAQELAAKFGIASIPTVLLFKDGKIAKSFVGLRPKRELAAAIDGLLA
jgi:thioredoxin 1